MNTEQLKQAALKATPGPWQQDASYEVVNSSGLQIADTAIDDNLFPHQCANNARFIAAANPATILALLECVDALRLALENYPGQAERNAAYAALQKLEALS